MNSDSTEVFIGTFCLFDANTQRTLINRHIIKEEIELLTQKIKELRITNYNGDIHVFRIYNLLALL